MNKHNYFIKKGYKSNKINLTLDSNRETNYWDKINIRKSFYYQYSTYKFAKKIILKIKLNSVLDLGCGPATKLIKLIQPITKKVVGIDQKNPIKFCEKKYKNKNSIFIEDNFDNPNKKIKDKFDLIISSDVIEHLEKPENLLNYMKLHSHTNTFFVISTPERDLLRGKKCIKSDKPEHIREWNKKEFVSMLEYYGFQVLKVKLDSHMKFNISYEYFSKLLLPTYCFNHNMIVLAKLKK